jgi:uncharacterized protein (TIGR02246 family)
MTMCVDDPGQLGQLFAERANVGDLEGMVALYEDDATFVGPDGGSASGRAAIRERLEALLAIGPQITDTSCEVVIAGDVALMSNRFRIMLGTEDGDGAGFDGASTEIARRQPDGGWLYLIDHPKLAIEAPAGARDAVPGAPRTFEQLIYEEDGPVARITLNRPERRNA